MLNVFKKTNYQILATIVLILVALFPLTASADGQTLMQGIVWGLVSAVFGTFAGIAGALLDTSIENYIIGFGDLYNTGGVGLAVNTVWVSVRDFFNITFIFGIVYIGFKMILGSDDSQTKTWLVNLIMAAILVNFSLYATKFVVDVSNAMASEIVTSAFQMTDKNGKEKIGVTTVFMNNMGATQLFSSAANSANEAPEGWGFVFGGMIMFVVMIFVFGAGAILILIRFAVLLIYMVLSPLMFIGWVFPQLKGEVSKYWSGFLGRAFFAPIYLFLLYISAQIIDDMVREAQEVNGPIQTKFGGSGQAIMESTEAVNGFPAYIIACIFLVASLVISQKMGAVGGTAVVSAGKRAGNKIRSKATSMTRTAAVGTARVAALPVTLPARKLSNSLGGKLDQGLTNFQAKERTGLVGKAAGAVSKWNGVDRAVRSGAQSLKDNKMGTGHTRDEDLLYKSKTDNRIAQNKSINESQAVMNSTTANLTDLEDAAETLAKTMRNMSKEDKLQRGYDQLNTATMALNLSDADLEHFEKSGKMSAQKIQNLKQTRNQARLDTITNGTVANSANPNLNPNTPRYAKYQDSQRQNIFRGNVNDIGKMSTDLFTEVQSYDYITPAMLEAKIKNGISTAEQAGIRSALEGHLGVGPGVQPNTVPGLANSPWVKWQNGNSVHAAKFFA